MLDIFGELEAAENDFVSICRLIERIALMSSHESPSRAADVPTICKWLLKRISESDKPIPCLRVLTAYYAIEVKFPDDTIEYDRAWVIQKLSSIIGMAKLPLKEHENAGPDDWFDHALHTSGFLRCEIEEFIPELVKKIEFPALQERTTDINLVAIETKFSSSQISNTAEIADNPDQPCKWDNFKGRDTALMMIAGLAISLSKSSGGIIVGDRLNVSAIARAAAKSINDYGDGVDLSDKALRNLVTEALKLHASKIEG